ncbi:hypothetical protein P154DRAFT_418550, partial [Amniculicola lignicola CBS 123094]
MFEYTALKDPSDEIRLLELQWDENEQGPLLCRMRRFKLRETPDYFALSYVWGNASPTQELFRTAFDWKSKPFLIWADAVCVNQSSVQERNQQVRIMHRIYRFASSVWVY